MAINAGNILLIISLLLLVSIIAGKTTSKLGVPTLIFFLVVGILAGSEGIGGIHFNDAPVTQLVGIVALNFILFSGGLDTNWKVIRPVLWRGVMLSTLGVLITTFAVGIFVHLVLNFTLAEGLLLGAIVSATDAAAVFSILRNKGIGLKGYLRPVLELESGSNDPMAYFLTISLTMIVKSGHFDLAHLLTDFLKEFLIGGVLGYLMGRASVWLINNIKLETEGLYPVLTLALAMLTYSVTQSIHGNGFLAIYICAIILGNSNFIHKRSLMQFYDGQAWLMQIILFLTLGLLVFPSKMVPIIGIGLLISAFLIFVARPLSVFISLSFFKSNFRSKLFVSWVGLRGGVPIVFATYPLIAGIEKADTIFNLVFFISVTSVLLQGTTLTHVAKFLHLDLPARTKRRTEIEIAENAKKEKIQVLINPGNPAIGRMVVQLEFPKAAQIMTIKRDNKYIIPVGATQVKENDKLFILAEDKHTVELVYDSLHLTPPQA